MGLGGALLLAVGCATPAARIRRHPDLFATFPPEVQASVRQGRIELGYTKPMIFIALGRPRSIYDRWTQGTNAQVWVYTDVDYATDLRPLPSSYWYRDRRGRLRQAYDWQWLDAGRLVEYDTLRVEFTGEKVSAVERLRR